MNDTTIDATQKIDMVIRYTIGSNYIHNDNKEANLFNENWIELNNET